MTKGLDLPLFAIILALGAISISVLLAASHNLALSQIIFWILGLSILYTASHFLYPNWQKLALPFYLISIASLFAVFVLGESIRGSVRWIDLGVFRFQPSEIAKVSTVLLLATFFVKRKTTPPNLFFGFLLVVPVFALIAAEPDIGSAISIVAIFISIAFAAGLKMRHFIFIAVALFTIGVLSYELLAPYQKERIATFVSPGRDPLGAGYNIIQSKIAVGSGQIFGRGLGRGSQSQLNFLPEAESDFIFAAISEQLGLLGSGLTITLFAMMATRISTFAKESDRFGQLVIMGALGLFIYQFSVNVGMNMGLIPVTGITLPLVSYGGSSLISSLLLLGIIFAIRSWQY